MQNILKVPCTTLLDCTKWTRRDIQKCNFSKNFYTHIALVGQSVYRLVYHLVYHSVYLMAIAPLGAAALTAFVFVLILLV